MSSGSEELRCAIDHHQAGRLREAEEIYRKVVQVEPKNAEAWHLLGVIACQQGAEEPAATCIGRALELVPDYAEAHNSLGILLQRQGRLEEAAACYRRAAELNPASSEPHYNLGQAWHELGKLDDAAASYRMALDVRPDHAEAHTNLGNALQDQGKLEEAIACHRQAAQLRPEFAEAHYNLGNAIYQQRHWEEAIACYERAIGLSPGFADAHNNLSRLSLLLGDFERGWAESEWRWQTGQIEPWEFVGPKWDGRPLPGQAILLRTEQGLGDTLQFIRYAALVKERVGTVLVECERALMPLLSSCPGVDGLMEEGAGLPRCDVYAALLSLPGVFRTTLKTIPGSVPYLHADDALVKQWQMRLADAKAYRIGINWQGRSGQGAHRQRDIPVECFAPLADVDEVRLVCLQRGAGRNDLTRTKELFPIADPGDDVDTLNGTFMDTAAIMMNLDLVITSDTSVAHLAGALGVPVWVALPVVPDWRWLLDRSDSPWYPTMRLFRQKAAGDWAEVFDEIREALEKLVGGG